MSSNYASINKFDTGNGEGCRCTLFLSGCEFNCPECFNPELHNFSYGKPFTDDTLKKLLSYCEPAYISGLSILGGEPLHPRNIDTTIHICQEFKNRFPDKTIWIWSGYLYESIVNKNVLRYIDVLVDGLFNIALRDLTLKFRGSSNQRLIDVKESLKQNTVVTL